MHDSSAPTKALRASFNGSKLIYYSKNCLAAELLINCTTTAAASALSASHRRVTQQQGGGEGGGKGLMEDEKILEGQKRVKIREDGMRGGKSTAEQSHN